MKLQLLYALFIILVMLILPRSSSAQIQPPRDPTDTPIDGGLSVLLAAGIGYGVKNVYNKRRKKDMDY